MGLSKSKTTQTNAPSSYAKPYIDAGANALGSAYGQSQGLASGISDTLASQLPGLQEKAFGSNAGLDAATGYNTDVLNGKYLAAGNPYLQGQIDNTNADVQGRVQSQFSAAGRTGSGANVNALGRALAANETGLRYTDYSNERQAMGQAAGLASGLNSAQYAGIPAYLQVAQTAAGLPLSTAQQYSGGLGSLLGGYTTQTGTSSPSLGMILAQMAGNAASAYKGGA